MGNIFKRGLPEEADYVSVSDLFGFKICVICDPYRLHDATEGSKRGPTDMSPPIRPITYVPLLYHRPRYGCLEINETILGLNYVYMSHIHTLRTRKALLVS